MAVRYDRSASGVRPPVWHQLILPRFSFLDVKLAMRMAARHPGVTLVAGLTLAIGIPIGLAPLQLTRALSAPPFRDGERIVGIDYTDVTSGILDHRVLADYEGWRTELRSFEKLGAYSLREQNVVGDNGRAEAVSAPRVSASTFAILGVRPLLGRTLIDADEAPGAVPVVVLQHDFWMRRFGGDSNIVGKTLRLGTVTRTIIGVMPAGFTFPHRNAKLWVPLQARAIDYPPGGGPMLWVFGRLRDGVSMDDAQAEAVTVWKRRLADDPKLYENLRVRVLPVTMAATELRITPYYRFIANTIALLLLIVSCGNVGTLILARTAARSSEIAIRMALGADRGRIVGQLFLEALVLSLGAAGIGLLVTNLVVLRLEPRWEEMPAWVNFGLTPATVALGLGLALLSATIAGALPALRATGRNVQRRLQQRAGGDSGLRFGLGATMLIVAEVALGVGFLSVVGSMALSIVHTPSRDIGVNGDEFLVTQLMMVTEPSRTADATTRAHAWLTRYGRNVEALVTRLRNEPQVRGVAVGSGLPGLRHIDVEVDVDSAPPPPDGRPGYLVERAGVHPGFFAGLGQAVLQGRDFYPPDFTHRSNNGIKPVIVNRAFVATVLGGRNAVGRRLRYVRQGPKEDWPTYEIVGVVNDLGANVSNIERAAAVYEPIAWGEMQPVQVGVRVWGDPLSFAPRLRSILLAIDPAMMLSDPQLLTTVVSENVRKAQIVAYWFAGLAFVALLLSCAGLYALMSFTVAARTYEIAVRVALGAGRWRVLGVVLTRSLLQLVCGVAAGGAIGLVLVNEFDTSATTDHRGLAVLATVAVAMAGIGLLACMAPAVRALRIEPVRALKNV